MNRIFRITDKQGKTVDVNTHGLGKVMEGVIVFHNEGGDVIAVFPVSEVRSAIEVAVIADSSE